MKVELHLHTNRYSSCAVATPQELMGALTTAGYHAVYITEHHHVWSDGELAELRADFPKLLIFPGVELNLTDLPLQHLLVLGTNDPSYLEMAGAAKVLARARHEGHLTVLAHPSRWEGAGRILEEGNLPDAIECRTGNQDFDATAKATALGETYGLPLVNSGDVHSLEMVGRYWIETNRPLVEPDDIRSIVLERAYQRRRAGDRSF